MIVVSVMLSLNEKMRDNVVKQPVLSNNWNICRSILSMQNLLVDNTFFVFSLCSD